MANSKKKNFWYIIVLTDEGAKFVTSLDYSTKYAKWDKTEKPLELSQSVAKDICLGLCLNGYNAFPVCSLFEVDKQPYNYTKGGFQWVWNDKQEDKKS